VVPQWAASLLKGQTVFINGDGETSRDFCFIDNCVQANILAATADDAATDQVYNVAFGERTSLGELYRLIQERVAVQVPSAAAAAPVYRDFRAGDVRHSLADIGKSSRLLGYSPEYSVRTGLDKASAWYINRFI
jgi:UDP-N-acetylglucosamine 4-epimerase